MNRFKNILFVADGRNQNCPALERAVALAESNHARLTVVDVINEFSTDEAIEAQLGVEISQLMQDFRQELLEKLVEPFQTKDHLIYTRVLVGTAFAEIIKTVLQNDYDLVIKAMRPSETLEERFLGSTDLHLLRKCPCPVWIDRPGKTIPYRKILAAVDPMSDDGAAIKIMQLATSLADREGARLEIVHAWRLPGESLLRHGRARLSSTEVDQIVLSQEKLHQDKLNSLLGDFGLSSEDANVHFVSGFAAARILEFGKSADLIVMSTIGRVGIPGFIIGNTAEDVLQSSESSILAVKPDGYVSPLA